MPAFFVVGATGQQGGAVVNALLRHRTESKQDITIKALTRNPTSASAKKLAERGIVLLKGSLTDEDALRRGLADSAGAYLVTEFRGPDDINGEIMQGKTFVDVAKAVGLPHLVFSSVAGADIAKEVEHFYSKFTIEEYIRNSGLSHTIIRPTGFLEVIPLDPWPRYFMMGAMQAAFGDVPQKWVACEDIGKAVCTAMLNPQKWKGKVVHVCGAVATVAETQKQLSDALGTSASMMWFPRWLVMSLTPHHYFQMFLWLAKGVQAGTVEETKTIVSNPLSIQEWARLMKAS